MDFSEAAILSINKRDFLRPSRSQLLATRRNREVSGSEGARLHATVRAQARGRRILRVGHMCTPAYAHAVPVTSHTAANVPQLHDAEQTPMLSNIATSIAHSGPSRATAAAHTRIRASLASSRSRHGSVSSSALASARSGQSGGSSGSLRSAGGHRLSAAAKAFILDKYVARARLVCVCAMCHALHPFQSVRHVGRAG